MIGRTGAYKNAETRKQSRAELRQPKPNATERDSERALSAVALCCPAPPAGLR